MISAHYLSRFLCSPLYNTREREPRRVGGNAARVAGASVGSASDQHVPRGVAFRPNRSRPQLRFVDRIYGGFTGKTDKIESGKSC